jgi:hypothetical protein
MQDKKSTTEKNAPTLLAISMAKQMCVCVTETPVGVDRLQY